VSIFTDNGRVLLALGKEDVVAECMSGRLLDLDGREVRVGREEGTTEAVRSMGVTSCVAGSVSSVCPRREFCRTGTVREMALV